MTFRKQVPSWYPFAQPGEIDRFWELEAQVFALKKQIVVLRMEQDRIRNRCHMRRKHGFKAHISVRWPERKDDLRECTLTVSSRCDTILK